MKNHTKRLLGSKKELITYKYPPLTEEEVEIELNSYDYHTNRRELMAVIPFDIMDQLMVGTFSTPPKKAKVPPNNSNLILEMLPDEILWYILEFLPIQKLLIISLTCTHLHDLVNDYELWKRVAMVHESLFIWKTLQVIIMPQGTVAIAGHLNPDIVTTSNVEEDLEYGTNEKNSKMKKFFHSSSRKLIPSNVGRGILGRVVEQEDPKPNSNKQIRLDYIPKLEDHREILIDKYQSLQKASSRRSYQETRVIENNYRRIRSGFRSQTQKLFLFALTFLPLAIFIFGILLNLSVIDKINGNNKTTKISIPIISVIGLMYLAILFSLIRYRSWYTLYKGVTYIIIISLIVLPLLLILLKIEHAIDSSWSVTFIPIFIYFSILTILAYVIAFMIFKDLDSNYLRFLCIFALIIISMPLVFFICLSLKLDNVKQWTWAQVFAPLFISIILMELIGMLNCCSEIYRLFNVRENHHFTLTSISIANCLLFFPILITTILFVLWIQTDRIKSFTTVMVPFYICSPSFFIATFVLASMFF
ncbi:dactylin [Anaeramoeba flamelloides]|uniref:Dactylin n=1 Tax=Anaeramoeba flamelloides TaxID=1746091 RepID=A0AAV7YCT5_9EUKA|nr:dactylin [Anaeramoeba flamelloides]